ncbi:MAG: hypothetical protein ACYCWE_17115 [Eubacteriales bacterium]
MAKRTTEPAPTLDLLDERACAFQQSLVFMRQAYPNMAVMTYDNLVHRGAEHMILAKIVTGIKDNVGKIKWLLYDTCLETTTADNIPGGLKSSAHTEDGLTVVTEIYPMIAGRDSMAWEGGAVVRIRCKGAHGLAVKFGCGDMSFMHFSPNEKMAGGKIDCENGSAKLENGYAVITQKDRPVILYAKSSYRMSVEKLPDMPGDFGTYIAGETDGEEAWLAFGFSRDAARTRELSSGNADAEIGKVKEYYRKTLENWEIKTPDASLDEAFMHARLNLEYSWLRPYGWIESIQHWPTMWHMEQAGAEEWAGYFDRTRECLRSQMKNIFENGAIPDMCCNGKGRRDWGGNNQFFFRELEHYVKMTGDIAFLKEAEPYLHRILDQTFAEYDPTGCGVIGWGTQIGNQEDMESTPGPGAATGIEGVRMLEIMGDFMRWLGHENKADKYIRYRDLCLDSWKKMLMQQDIGRPIWYVDVSGEKRLDTTYHGLCYPLIYGYTDDFYKVSFSDHIKHRLSGEEGEMFQSNHFGDHAYHGVPTWGMQCGSDMQAFGTAAYAAIGDGEAAMKPLSFIALRVCGDYQRGSWPETANERRYAYFSPSAGVYAQSIIESIFGIRQNLIEGITIIEPCFPKDWDHAMLRVNGASMQYEKSDGEHTFRLRIDNNTKKIFRLKLKPYAFIEAVVNGKPVPVRTKGGCGWFEAEIDLSDDIDYEIKIRYELLNLTVEYPKSAACGANIAVNIFGADFCGIDDRCGIMQNVRFGKNSLTAKLRDNLLQPYEKFGWFGLINFARRMFAVTLSHGGIIFTYPCVITVVPEIVCKADAAGNEIHLTFVNNTNADLENGVLSAAGLSMNIGQTLKAGSMTELMLPLDAALAAVLVPGKNQAAFWNSSTAPVRFDMDYRTDGDRIRQIPLPDDMLMPIKDWKKIGLHAEHGCIIQGPDSFMHNLMESTREISFDGISSFALNPVGFIPMQFYQYRVTEIPLDGIRTKKLYILISAFIDNHDVFSTVFKLELETEKEGSFIRPVYRKELTLPGELDMGYGGPVIAGFDTYNASVVRNRLPKFPLGGGDYGNIRGPLYPERSFWCVNRAAESCNTVFNLIEIELAKESDLKTLRLICNEADAAGGIFGIAVL